MKFYRPDLGLNLGCFIYGTIALVFGGSVLVGIWSLYTVLTR